MISFNENFNKRTIICVGIETGDKVDEHIRDMNSDGWLLVSVTSSVSNYGTIRYDFFWQVMVG